jgi:hypothetical protein
MDDFSSIEIYQRRIRFLEELVEYLLKKLDEAEPPKDVEVNVYDKVTEYDNCTVQILENTATGAISVGWWRNDGE